MKYAQTKRILNQLVIDLTQAHELVRQHHWYMRGQGFLTLHPYLDPVMDELDHELDDVAERLITLDGSPVASLAEVAQNSNIDCQVAKWDLTIKDRFSAIVAGMRILEHEYEQGIEVSDQEGDYSTNDMLTGFHTEIEKLIWMMQAELGAAPAIDQD